jgi:hypothetical protein
MPFDGSGNFNRVRNWVSDALANIKIVASRHDSEDDNFASGLSQCITKDGQTQPTADIPMNGKKLINLGAPSTGTDAVNKTYADTADNLKAPIASPTFTGKVTLPTGVAGSAPLRLPVVTANPTAPVSGDVWPDITTGAWKYRLTSTTLTFGALELAQTWSAAQTFSTLATFNAGLSITAGSFLSVSQLGLNMTTIGAIGQAGSNTGSALAIASPNNAGSAAFLSFNRSAAYAVNFGLDTDNILKVGGWSMGASAYKILHEGLATGTFAGVFTWSGAQTFSVGPTVPTAAVGTNTTQAASTAFVQAAIGPGNAALAAGAVGTWGLCATNPGAGVAFGDVVAGSGLRMTHCGGFNGAGTVTPSGSWRCMGVTVTGGGAGGATVFLRVS